MASPCSTKRATACYKSFQSKEDAQRWARQIEAEIDKGSFTSVALAERTLFKDLIERYVQEVTLKTRSMREDTYRLKALARHPIANLQMTALTPIGCNLDSRLYYFY